MLNSGFQLPLPGVLGTSPQPSASRLAIISLDRSKAELWHYFCAQGWGFEVAVRTSNRTEGIEAVKRMQPDVIMASIGPHDMGLSDYVTGLLAAAPFSRLVLLLSSCIEYQIHLLSTLEYHGLLYEPDEDLTGIGRAIEKILQGLRVISPRIAQCQADLRNQPTAFSKLLTKRQLDVLICIAHSLTEEEAACQLNMSKGTVHVHRRNIMDKLDIHKATKLLRYCAEKGFCLVPLPTPSSPKEKGTKCAVPI